MTDESMLVTVSASRKQHCLMYVVILPTAVSFGILQIELSLENY